MAVKVQRPSVLQTVSKDLYVLRRAAEVYQGLIDRFAPQQRTNYVALLNEWAVGFYTGTTRIETILILPLPPFTPTLIPSLTVILTSVIRTTLILIFLTY